MKKLIWLKFEFVLGVLMSKNTDKRLNNKVALITGAGSGIGRATSLRFAKEGARVIVTDINIETAQETVKLIKTEMQGEAIAIGCDISNKDEVKSMVKQASDQFARIDIVFNNAGIGVAYGRNICRVKETDWDKIMAVNLKGQWLVAKSIWRKMNAQKFEPLAGKMIHTSSIAGMVPDIGMPVTWIPALVSAAPVASASLSFAVRVSASRNSLKSRPC